MAEKRRKSRNLEVFAIGFDIEPALFSVLDDMVERLGLPLYCCVARLFVARKKADFTVLEEVGKTVGAKINRVVVNGEKCFSRDVHDGINPFLAFPTMIATDYSLGFCIIGLVILIANDAEFPISLHLYPLRRNVDIIKKRAVSVIARFLSSIGESNGIGGQTA